MKLTLVLVMSLGAAALVSVPAYAYLDPGTGSALVQGLIASIAALGLTLKVYWHRVVGLLGLRRKTEPGQEANVSTPTISDTPPAPPE